MDRPAGREWIVANGLGGYAAGPASGPATRRYHALLVAALPPPVGRAVRLDGLGESVVDPDGSIAPLEAIEPEFRPDLGLPVWIYQGDGWAIERRVWMSRARNRAVVRYRLVPGSAPVRLRLAPMANFRGNDGSVGPVAGEDYRVQVGGPGRIEIEAGPATVRVAILGASASFRAAPRVVGPIAYPIEAERGYASTGTLWSPGDWELDLEPGRAVAAAATTDPWSSIDDLDPDADLGAERARRRSLIERSGVDPADPVAAALVLAADAFVVEPHGGGRTIIAGYHWFTDWGRDALIALEGLTLATNRPDDARLVLERFAGSVRDGLVPNLFPEGAESGVYHTADATLWLFHALDRYAGATADTSLIDRLRPALLDIVDHHARGTRFGIGVDPADGLLRQGEAGYQLTWMDAKAGDWVVTPRRGKAIEINALWYNALRLLEGWSRDRGDAAAADRLGAMADRCDLSFNRRFWDGASGRLFDVVDGETGDDPSVRPNQLLAFTLRHPVLDPSRWAAVLEVARAELLTPVGLRSLAPGDPAYQPRYAGDVVARDGAYHRGTAWSWLIGPYVDAHLKVHPGDRAGARAPLAGLAAHLGEAGIGQVSEVFDGDAPHRPGGCAAQAWGVAELLRCWRATGIDR